MAAERGVAIEVESHDLIEGAYAKVAAIYLINVGPIMGG
jgi:hypothetical protein